ncbi:MAG TPA: hypothetical protein VM182_16670 [Terriglobia bacterium]|nr:hypothetical protein [Terriglobia bacterium]
MKTKRTFLAICTVLLLAAASGTAYGQTCGTPTVVALRGMSIVAGIVTVSNTSGELSITYATNNGWAMTDTKLDFGKSLSDIPTNTQGNPKLGQFGYPQPHSPSVTSYTHTFDLDVQELSVGDLIYIGAYAAVQNGAQTEAAWGYGTQFNGSQGNWATYFTYEIQACAPPTGIIPGDFRTQTQGGWGTKCKGENPGCYRDANFVGTFPTGLVVGVGNTATFTNSIAIQDFLPAGGGPGAFTTNYTNPPTTSAGVLAGQVVALKLSVEFDLYDANFGASTTRHLADLIVAKEGDDCENMTVQAVLDEANYILGGGTSSLTASQINGCVDKINKNFTDGTYVGTYLKLP